MTAEFELVAMEAPPEEPPPSGRRSGGCCCGVGGALRGVALEPVMFLQNALSQMVFVTSQALMIEKACIVNDGFSASQCSSLHDSPEREQLVQDQVAAFLAWRSVLEAALKFTVVLFAGPLSDRWGRRWPLVGCLLLLAGESALMLANALARGWPLEMMLVCSVSYGLSGGHYALLMLCFSHVSDTSQTDSRTFRMGCLDTFWYFGRSVGSALQPAVLAGWGYGGVFGASAALYVAAALYVCARLKPAHPEPPRTEAPLCCQCDLRDSVKALTKPRENRGRRYLALLVVLLLLDAFAATGEGDVKYLFVTSAAGWSSAHYSYWSSASSALTVTCAFVVFPLLPAAVRLPDEVVGLAGALSRLAVNLCFLPVRAASQAWLLYLGSALGSLAILPPVALRSMMSKIARTDVGAVLGSVAALESLAPLAAGPLYLAVYRATNGGLPGAYNAVSALLHGAMAGAFGYLIYTFSRLRRNSSLPF